MKFSPYFPLKPYAPNSNSWGRLDPVTYKQFGFTRHNGQDLPMTPSKIVRAPYLGRVYQNGFQPNGGGIYTGFLSEEEYDFTDFDSKTTEGLKIHFPAGKFRVLMDFLHLQSISAVLGKDYQPGEVLAVQDNTGFSTGAHCHVQCRRVLYDGKNLTFVDRNDAHGSFDPTPFWNGFYAEDVLMEKIVEKTSEVVQVISEAQIPNQEKVTFLNKVEAFLKLLFK